MFKTTQSKLNIRKIIEGESVTALYQPIISLKRKGLIGFEGLAHGFYPDSKAVIPHEELSLAASQGGLSLALDRLRRKKVLEQFKPIQEAYPDTMLTLSFDGSILGEEVEGSGHLIQTVKNMGLNPWNICIEIIESKADNVDELQKFVDTYRDYGFLIALEDVGTGHFNLNHIVLLKPDIMKVDRSLIEGIQDNFYKQQILKSLVFLCRTLGTMIIAEGVETKEEALTVLQLGADMLQGDYFSKPQEPSQSLQESHTDKITDLATTFRTGVGKKIRIKRVNYTKYNSMIEELLSDLSQTSASAFDLKLFQAAARLPFIECFYIIDEKGIQETKTYFSKNEDLHNNKLMFRPAPKGTDHSMKDYYYMLIEDGVEKSYITEPYLSMASGNLGVTISTLFTDTLQKKYLFCVDIKAEKSVY
jgi:EAL domain-containing protein (putative c-di-GMP-specific phosphodiesterase class I)